MLYNLHQDELFLWYIYLWHFVLVLINSESPLDTGDSDEIQDKCEVTCKLIVVIES